MSLSTRVKPDFAEDLWLLRFGNIAGCRFRPDWEHGFWETLDDPLLLKTKFQIRFHAEDGRGAKLAEKDLNVCFSPRAQRLGETLRENLSWVVRIPWPSHLALRLRSGP